MSDKVEEQDTPYFQNSEMGNVRLDWSVLLFWGCVRTSLEMRELQGIPHPHSLEVMILDYVK